MEKRRIADDIHIRMLFTVFFQPLHRIFVSFGLPDIKGDLMFKILPLIRHGVVHMHRVPDDIG